MNHDENKTGPKDVWIEPGLEARVVAWVAGEASAFEIAELERLVAEKPELAIFKRRIEAVQGLVGEAVRPDKEPLRLGAERREKLLATIGAGANTGAGGSASKDAPVAFPLSAGRKRWAKWQWTIGVAATLAFGGFLTVFLLQSRFAETDRKVAVAQEILDGEKAKVAGAASREPRLVRPSYMVVPDPDRAPANQSPGEIPDQTVILSPFEVRKSDSFFTRARKQVEETFRSAPTAEPAGPAARPASKVYSGGRGGGGAGGRSEMDDQGRFANQARAEAVAQALREQDVRRKMPGREQRERQEGAVAPAALGFSRTGGIPAMSPPAGPMPRPLASVPEFRIAMPDVAPTMSVQKIELSPFEVSESKDKGYAAGNTLSGTRLNSTVQDMAGSISVVTKQQLVDAGAVGENRFFYDAPAKKEAGVSDGFALLAKNAGGLPAVRDDRADPSPPPRVVVPVVPVGETSAAKEAVSTFSLHVSDVSFRLAQAALARGEMPDATRIRPEEFYNAFDYGDPVPTVAEKVGVRIEQSAHPVAQQRNLVRIAMKVPSTGRGAGVPLRLTVLLDTSGSMEREDRAAAVRSAMGALVSLLGPNDRITLIGFARQPRLLAEAVAGNEAGRLLQTMTGTPAEGGTNLEEALKLAHELAARHFQAVAQNRIVLLTDGVVNLGEVMPATLAARVEALRRSKIAFDVCGVGLNDLDDTMLEALARKGDGRYTALDAADAAGGGFARQLAGAFRPAAENVKVQVRFNPARVGNYRLIGFEQHRLNEADFRNDQVDAAELAAEEAAVALYQVEALPQGTGEIGEVFVRFRDAATGEMVERSWTIGYDAGARAFDRATPTMQLAGTAALLAEKLRKHPSAEQFRLVDLAPVVNGLRGHFPQQARVRELVEMFGQARRMGRE